MFWFVMVVVFSCSSRGYTSFLSVVTFFNNFTADLGEEPIHWVYVILRWHFHYDLAIRHFLLEVLRVECWHSSAQCQITFCSNDDGKYLFRFVFHILIPLTELVEWLPIINSVDEYYNTTIFEEEMSQVMNNSIASTIPNIELQSISINFLQLPAVLRFLNVRRLEVS